MSNNSDGKQHLEEEEEEDEDLDTLLDEALLDFNARKGGGGEKSR
jgi:hypothetical protein